MSMWNILNASVVSILIGKMSYDATAVHPGFRPFDNRPGERGEGRVTPWTSPLLIQDQCWEWKKRLDRNDDVHT